MSLSLH